MSGLRSGPAETADMAGACLIVTLLRNRGCDVNT